MKIHKLHIVNFKGFAEKTFELNEHMTVFIGNNATGKTSVLDALAISLGAFFSDIEKIHSRPIREDEIRVEQIDGQPKPQKPVVIEASGEIDGKELSWKREIVRSKTTSKDLSQIRKIAVAKLSKSRAESGVIFPVIAYHGTGRLWAEHEKTKVPFQKQKEGVKMAYNNCLSAKSSSKEFLAWYKTLEDTISKFGDPLHKSHLAAFKQTILGLVPDEQWQDMAFNRQKEELMGMFSGPEGDKTYLAYSQLSDGFRNFIGMAADIAYRCIQLNPHLGERAVIDTPGVVLIDELDLHLHPKWQRHVVADLKRVFPQIQFVATTHSPFIVQSLASDELINLDRVVESSPNEMSISEVSEWLMGVASSFSYENAEAEKQSQSILERLDSKETTGDDIQVDIDNVSNPGVRAFLNLAKMAKGK